MLSGCEHPLTQQPSREYCCAKPAVLICIVDEGLNEEVTKPLHTTMQVMVYNRLKNLYLFVCFFVYHVYPQVCCMSFLCMWAAQLDNYIFFTHSLAICLFVCLFDRVFLELTSWPVSPRDCPVSAFKYWISDKCHCPLPWRYMLGIQTQTLALVWQLGNVFVQSVS